AAAPTLATPSTTAVTAAPTIAAPVQALPNQSIRQGLPQKSLTPTWTLRPDEQPSMGQNSEVLLFVHGMDSRAEEADDITHALFNGLMTRPPTTGAASTAVMIASNFHTVGFSSSEMCAHPDAVAANGQKIAVVPFDTVNGAKTPLYFVPDTPPVFPGMPQVLLDGPSPNGAFNVPAAHNIGANEGRLRADLKAVAAAAQPLPPPPTGSLSQAAYKFALNDPTMGRAFADLAVTGRRSFAAFKQALPQDAFCQTLSAAPVPAPYPQMNPNDI